MRYRFVQLTRKGIWISPGVFDDSFETIVANVVRGYVAGEPRAAIAVDGGALIFALDAAAKATTDATPFAHDRHEAA